MQRSPEARLYLDTDEIVVDSFAGGGGASFGISMATGRSPDIAINHDPEAIALHRANHPESEHHIEDVWHVDPVDACRGRRVGLMWLSPDCKHFSKAKGAKPVSPRVRGLAWVAVRWARAVRPRLIILENVEEFQQWGPLDKKGRPVPAKKGLSFRIFVGRLKGLGYTVEWRQLRGCWYGAPTTRKRLFLIARCDGLPIVWPRPTHAKVADGVHEAFRTAGRDVIDFSIPCPSIFARKKPLAVNTQRRIAMGLKRFVLESDKPFIVPLTHQGDARVHSLDAPLPTITGAHRGEHALVTPVLTKYHGQRREGEARGCDLELPIPTLDTSNRFGLVAPVFVPRYGEDPNRTTRSGHQGQEPRARSVDQPMPTIVPTANGATLVAGFLAKHYGGHTTPGTQLHLPIDAVTSRDHHHLVAATMVNMRGTHPSQLVGHDIDSPLPTISAGGIHAAEVRAFLVSFYSTQQRTGDLFDPIATVTPKDRFGLVTVAGQDYQLVDIGMRMLTPRELYRGQGFPDSYRIDITYRGKPLSKTAQVRMCGNSVNPHVAAALVLANLAQRAGARRVA